MAKKINYFKAEDETHRSEYGRREQKWRWLRKMKRKHRVSKKEFVKGALGVNLFTKLPRLRPYNPKNTANTTVENETLHQERGPHLPNRGDQSGWQP